VLQLADITFVVGGTEAARRTRAAMGLRPQNRVQIVARPLHPFRQISSDPSWNWKTPARLLRNVAWNLRRDISASKDWSVAYASPAQLEESLRPRPLESFQFFGQTTALVKYLAECPIIRFALCIVRRREQPVGYFCLSYAPGQARIADCSLIDPTPENWVELYRLATAEADRDSSANEIVAWSVTDAQRSALETCGFHVRSDEQIMISDAARRVPATAAIYLQMIHTDMAFLHSGLPSYLT